MRRFPFLAVLTLAGCTTTADYERDLMISRAQPKWPSNWASPAPWYEGNGSDGPSIPVDGIIAAIR